MTFLFHDYARFKRSELRSTEIDENAIAPAANIGLRNPSAASGIPTVL